MSLFTNKWSNEALTGYFNTDRISGGLTLQAEYLRWLADVKSVTHERGDKQRFAYEDRAQSTSIRDFSVFNNQDPRADAEAYFSDQSSKKEAEVIMDYLSDDDIYGKTTDDGSGTTLIKPDITAAVRANSGFSSSLEQYRYDMARLVASQHGHNINNVEKFDYMRSFTSGRSKFFGLKLDQKKLSNLTTTRQQDYFMKLMSDLMVEYARSVEARFLTALSTDAFGYMAFGDPSATLSSTNFKNTMLKMASYISMNYEDFSREGRTLFADRPFVEAMIQSLETSGTTTPNQSVFARETVNGMIPVNDWYGGLNLKQMRVVEQNKLPTHTNTGLPSTAELVLAHNFNDNITATQMNGLDGLTGNIKPGIGNYFTTEYDGRAENGTDLRDTNLTAMPISIRGSGDVRLYPGDILEVADANYPDRKFTYAFVKALTTKASQNISGSTTTLTAATSSTPAYYTITPSTATIPDPATTDADVDAHAVILVHPFLRELHPIGSEITVKTKANGTTASTYRFYPMVRLNEIIMLQGTPNMSAGNVLSGVGGNFNLEMNRMVGDLSAIYDNYHTIPGTNILLRCKIFGLPNTNVYYVQFIENLKFIIPNEQVVFQWAGAQT